MIIRQSPGFAPERRISLSVSPMSVMFIVSVFAGDEVMSPPIMFMLCFCVSCVMPL